MDSARRLLAVGLALSIWSWTLVTSAVVVLGEVLTLLGIYGLGRHLRRDDMVKNMLAAFLISVFITTVFTTMSLLPLGGGLRDVPHLSTFMDYLNLSTSLLSQTWGWLLFWLLWWAVFVAYAYFLKRAFVALAEAADITLLKTAAAFIWAGALSIPLMLGKYLMITGQILAVLAVSTPDGRLEKKIKKLLDIYNKGP
ncbi:MAG: DUF996 domain-containing protein [Pyrobaculum sp.]